MNKAIGSMILFCSLLPGQARAQAEQPTKPPNPTDLAAEIHRDNQLEIELAQGAAKNATVAEVKQLAQTIEQDRRAADTELQELATKNKWRLKTAKEMDERVHKVMEAYRGQLKVEKGPRYDSAYLSAVLYLHVQDMAMLNQAATSLKGEPMGNYLAQLLPKLRQHQEEAYRLLGAQLVRPD